MTLAITPTLVTEAHATAHRAAIDNCTELANAHLRTHAAYPAGHWNVSALVPMKYREEIAERFRSAGWRVSYNTEPDAYSDYFHIGPAL